MTNRITITSKALISEIVSPTDCAQVYEVEFEGRFNGDPVSGTAIVTWDEFGPSTPLERRGERRTICGRNIEGTIIRLVRAAFA